MSIHDLRHLDQGANVEHIPADQYRPSSDHWCGKHELTAEFLRSYQFLHREQILYRPPSGLAHMGYVAQ